MRATIARTPELPKITSCKNGQTGDQHPIHAAHELPCNVSAVQTFITCCRKLETRTMCAGSLSSPGRMLTALISISIATKRASTKSARPVWPSGSPRSCRSNPRSGTHRSYMHSDIHKQSNMQGGWTSEAISMACPWASTCSSRSNCRVKQTEILCASTE